MKNSGEFGYKARKLRQDSWEEEKLLQKNQEIKLNTDLCNQARSFVSEPVCEKKKLYQALKDPQKIKACFNKGISIQQNGLFCKVLKPDRNGQEKGIKVLINASSRVRKKVKKNRIKRIIRAQLANFLQGTDRGKIDLAYLVLIGNEQFALKTFNQRAQILSHIIKEARLMEN